MLFTEMNDVEKREVRMYGCTVLEMKEAIEHRLDTRFDGSAALMARSMISDCKKCWRTITADALISWLSKMSVR